MFTYIHIFVAGSTLAMALVSIHEKKWGLVAWFLFWTAFNIFFAFYEIQIIAN